MFKWIGFALVTMIVVATVTTGFLFLDDFKKKQDTFWMNEVVAKQNPQFKAIWEKEKPWFWFRCWFR